MYTKEELELLVQGTPIDENNEFITGNIQPDVPFMYYNKDMDYLMEAVLDSETGELEDIDAIAPMVYILKFMPERSGFSLIEMGDPYQLIRTGELVDGDIIMLISIADDTEVVTSLLDVADENGIYMVMTNVDAMLHPEQYDDESHIDINDIEEYVKSQGITSLEISKEDDDTESECECGCCHHHHVHDEFDDDDDEDIIPDVHLTLYSGTNIFKTAVKYSERVNLLAHIIEAVDQ